MEYGLDITIDPPWGDDVCSCRTVVDTEVVLLGLPPPDGADVVLLVPPVVIFFGNSTLQIYND